MIPPCFACFFPFQSFSVLLACTIQQRGEGLPLRKNGELEPTAHPQFFEHQIHSETDWIHSRFPVLLTGPQGPQHRTYFNIKANITACSYLPSLPSLRTPDSLLFVLPFSCFPPTLPTSSSPSSSFLLRRLSQCYLFSISKTHEYAHLTQRVKEKQI